MLRLTHSRWWLILIITGSACDGVANVLVTNTVDEPVIVSDTRLTARASGTGELAWLQVSSIGTSG